MENSSDHCSRSRAPRARAASAVVLGLITVVAVMRWSSTAAIAVGPPPAIAPALTVDLQLKSSGNDYDDLCFWRDPRNVDDSLVFVTSKSGHFVEVYRLATGQLLRTITGFVSPNNCDVTGDLLVTTDSHAGKKVLVHHIPDFTLVATLNQNFTNAQGVGVLHENGRDLAFITDQDQMNVHVYDLGTFQRLRTFPTGFVMHEGVAPDDLYHRVYISDAGTALVRAFSPTGTLLGEFGPPDIGSQAEGVALYRCGTGGWIVVSDQRQAQGGASEFEVYERTTFAHVGTFTLKNAAGDVTNATDGVDFFQVPTSRFPAGVFGASDNCQPGKIDDTDLISWDRVATALGLAVCPDGQPLTCGNGAVDRFEQCDGRADAACPGRCQADCLCAPAPPRCGDGIINQTAEQCDAPSAAACPGACRTDCTCPPVCGDGRVNQATELCDKADDRACPGRCRPDCGCTEPTVALSLGPLADTYIEQGAQGTWDHGAALFLSVRGKPSDVSYLKFDLSPLRGPVTRGTLTLWSTKASSDGGTIYPVTSTSWIEGNRTGKDKTSATGLGLKWVDADANRDGKLDARDLSSLVPDFTRPAVVVGKVLAKRAYAVDVTRALQDGPGLYTLALSGNPKSSTGATYGSRESVVPAQRPLLRIEGPGCATAADCDDHDPCTDETCDPVTGCAHVANTRPCDDGNACTTGDTCGAGKCAGGPPLACNDGNVCTDDACDPYTGCVHTANTRPCDDGNPCTAADACAGRACVGGPPLPCDDHDACTADSCRAHVGCVYVPDTRSYNDGNPCTDDGCNPATGCTHVDNTATCDDGDACTTADRCAAGRCAGGPARGCDDGNTCTNDRCDPAAGCQHVDNTASCEDGNACTTSDVCAGGVCVGGPATGCDDGNACTDDRCDPAHGCVHADNTAPCDDHDACTTGEACAAGSCRGGLAAGCDDGNGCTDDTCDPAHGCVHADNTAPCDDANACTTADQCAGGICLGGPARSCDDHNGCTDDTCDPAHGCVHAGNSAQCEDGSVCTVGDACAGGVCVGGPGMRCDDGNPCTDDTCDPARGCVHSPNTAPCDDGNACTTGDMCGGGTCLGGAAPACSDGNPCTDDGCDPGHGCIHSLNAAPCDDGNACTTHDECGDGTCRGGLALECNDGDPCTDDQCDPATGCTYVHNVGPCDDGDACTTGDTCQAGVCVGRAGPACDDGNPCTNDACDPARGCVHADNTAPCDDHDACTTDDRCADGACTGGPARTCDDGNPCTDDACEPATGCVAADNAAACDDGSACTVDDSCAGGQCVGGPAPTCDDGNPCTDDVCDPAGGCTHPTNTAPCDDGSACTVDDTCAGGACVGGPPRDCDDGNGCTDDACDRVGGCVHLDNTEPCDDGDACTTTDACVAGVCVGGMPPTCDDQDVCTDDTCDPARGCAFAPNTAPCDDGDACTAQDTCAAGVCGGTTCGAGVTDPTCGCE